MHFSAAIKINWTISDAIKVTEGDGVEVSLTAQAFGVYAIPITIGVMCTGDTDSDEEPGMNTFSNSDTVQHAGSTYDCII